MSVLSILTILLLLLVLLPVRAAFLERKKQRHREARLRNMLCTQCRKKLGEKSLELGKMRDETEISSRGARFRSGRFRRLMKFVAVCANCGTEYVEIFGKGVIRDLPGLEAEWAANETEYQQRMKERREYWRQVVNQGK